MRGSVNRDKNNTQANSMAVMQRPEIATVIQRPDLAKNQPGKGHTIINHSTFEELPNANQFDAAKIPKKFQLPQLNLHLNNTNRFDMLGVVINQS